MSEQEDFEEPTAAARKVANECHFANHPDGEGGLVVECRSTTEVDWYFRYEIDRDGKVSAVLFRDCRIVFMEGQS